MDEQIWVIEDFEEKPEEPQVEQGLRRFCDIMASTQDFDSRNLGLITSKSSIDEMWMSYSQEDQATWVIDSACTSHITKTQKPFSGGNVEASTKE